MGCLVVPLFPIFISDCRRGSLCSRQTCQACLHRGEGGGEGDRQDEARRRNQDPDVAGGPTHEARSASKCG